MKQLIVITLIVLMSGCESEFDKCMKANINERTMEVAKAANSESAGESNLWSSMERIREEMVSDGCPVWGEDDRYINYVAGNRCFEEYYRELTEIRSEWHVLRQERQAKLPEMQAKVASGICNMQGIYE